jgi:phosphatidylserine/phosphatidylglycerophosphate/cardiolipin synthase-like enzyme
MPGGVRAHILLDGFGTLQMPAEYRDEEGGCEVASFRPLTPLAVLSPRDRQGQQAQSPPHSVVDGRVGFTGGSAPARNGWQ